MLTRTGNRKQDYFFLGLSNPKKRVKLDDQPRESALAPVAASDTFTTFLPE
jgi:hypothetical protein